MNRMISSCGAAALVAWLTAFSPAHGEALAAEASRITAFVDPRTCRLLEQHVPDPGVAYVPGRDVRGNAVAPADLSPPVEVPSRFRFELEVDPFDYSSSRDIAAIDRRIVVLPPGSPRRDFLIDRRERLLREREANAAGFEDTTLSAGVVEVDTLTGQVVYEGQVLSPPDREALLAACRARTR